MPREGRRWRFITINTHCSWLPGDQRGFRNRDHRIDSSGDYKNPPPPEEHAGLREHNQDNSGNGVEIPKHLRALIGRAIVARLEKEGYRILAVSVSHDHAHILVELPDNIALVRRIIGRCKRAACEAVKHELPRRIWSAGGDWDPIDDREHQDNSYSYALTKQGPAHGPGHSRTAKPTPDLIDMISPTPGSEVPRRPGFFAQRHPPPKPQADWFASRGIPAKHAKKSGNRVALLAHKCNLLPPRKDALEFSACHLVEFPHPTI